MKRYACHGCKHCGFDVLEQHNYCRRNERAFPQAGDDCRHFERYAGSEPSKEVD